VGQGDSAGGSCAYPIGVGEWELCGLHQGAPDDLVAYDIYPIFDSLKVDNNLIMSWIGGSSNFSLDAGYLNANREYLLLGSASYTPGVSPGIPLKGGAVLPITYDTFTTLLLSHGIPYGYYGALSNVGKAQASLVIPANVASFDIDMTFAYCLRNPSGLNFASNYVQVQVKAWWPSPIYKYDDGVGDNLYCNINGGEICFLHAFDSGPTGDTIEYVSNVYGSKLYPGYGPGNGHPTNIFIWDDPTNDMDPVDCVLLDKVGSNIQFEDLDIFVDTQLNTPFPNISQIFFVGVAMMHNGASGSPVQYVCPLDDSTTHPLAVWRIGSSTKPFDYNSLSNNQLYTRNTDGVWLLRAKSE